MNKNLYLITTLLVTSIFYVNCTNAQETINLEPIVVTSTRYQTTVLKSAAAVSVIDAETIQKSQAQTVLDILRSTEAITVRDWTGNASKATVDIRGFGEQSQLNVLVLIDGRRTNLIDMSQVDWTQIPINQIERIEILRGSSASVLYGDNANSGVINIITKKPIVSSKNLISFSAGSYDMHKEELLLSGTLKNTAYLLSAMNSQDHGYRKNNYYKSQDFVTKLKHQLAPTQSATISFGFHDADYGLPGALSETNIVRYGKKASIYPKDHAKDQDYYIMAALEQDFLGKHKFNADISFRQKKTDSLFLSSMSGFNPISRSCIETVGLNPRYRINTDLLGLSHNFLFGIDLYITDYSSNSYDDNNILQNTTDIDKNSTGWYVQDTIDITEKLSFVAGLRLEQALYSFDYHDLAGWNSDVDDCVKKKEYAWNTAFNYRYNDLSKIFFSVARAFRFPAADEYFSVWATVPVNSALKTQTNYDYECGIRHGFSLDSYLEAILFLMDVENELFYDPTIYANRNYDKTRHQGIEISLTVKPVERLRLSSNYTYRQATFREGIYNHKDIPMVPRQQAAVNATWDITDNFFVVLNTIFIGKRRFINDQANVYSPLNKYTVTDLGIGYKARSWILTAGVNNIFNRSYAEYGVCNNLTGTKSYYPAKGKNFSVRLKYIF
ncbi:MAG: TonB-dependent receptor [Candidatus Omnitrophica bacterium]|nr:TonB-dependent receptor [Candidatus Omnitrophota bacterium]